MLKAPGLTVPPTVSDLPPPERTSHPLWMYDMIKVIPSSFAVVLEQLGKPRIPKGDRIMFTGNGTAFYSAWMGSQVLSEIRIPCRVVQSFELEHYIRPLKN